MQGTWEGEREAARRAGNRGGLYKENECSILEEHTGKDARDAAQRSSAKRGAVTE